MDVAKASFEKRFMGYWFQSPTATELEAAVGGNPVEVVGEPAGDGMIRVKQSEWAKALAGNESLLQTAKVAVALKM